MRKWAEYINVNELRRCHLPFECDITGTKKNLTEKTKKSEGGYQKIKRTGKLP